MTHLTCWVCGARSRYKGRCTAHMDPRLDTERTARALSAQGGRPLEMFIPRDVQKDRPEAQFGYLRRRGDWPGSLPVPRDVRAELGLDRAPIRKESQ